MMTMPGALTVVMEDDVALRPLQVVLDRECDPQRQAAFADFMRHDVPDLDAWCQALRRRAPGISSARVIPVANAAALVEALPGAVVAVVEELRITEELLDRAPRLRLVQKFGTTLGNIDVEACERRGIAVRTVRRRTNIAVAEHSVALLLALAKRLPVVGGRVTPERLSAVGHPPARYDRRHTANSNWGRFTGLRTLHGATLGLIGLGEIGREVARMAAGFGMRLLYTQRTRMAPDLEEALGVAFASIDDLLAGSDFVSLHVPLNETTRGLVGTQAFARMKPGAILINTARAELVDRKVLLDALRAGRLGGVGFDVLYEEPAGEHEPLLAFDDVLLTPHLAGAARHNGLGDIAEMVIGMEEMLGSEERSDARGSGI